MHSFLRCFIGHVIYPIRQYTKNKYLFILMLFFDKYMIIKTIFKSKTLDPNFTLTLKRQKTHKNNSDQLSHFNYNLKTLNLYHCSGKKQYHCLTMYNLHHFHCPRVFIDIFFNRRK